MFPFPCVSTSTLEILHKASGVDYGNRSFGEEEPKSYTSPTKRHSGGGAKGNGTPKKTAQEVLLAMDARRQKQRNSCMEFILVIVFMLGFLLLMWIHEDIERIYELEHVLKLTLTKKSFGPHSHTFRDVKDVVEIWEWLDYGLLPTIVKHKDPVTFSHS
jgi:hypothetical protein